MIKECTRKEINQGGPADEEESKVHIVRRNERKNDLTSNKLK